MKLSRTTVEALTSLVFAAASAGVASTMWQPSPPPPFEPDVDPDANTDTSDTDSSALRAHALRAHALPVADYILDVNLDTDSHDVRGTGTIRWRNRSERAVTSLYLHLFANAFKSDRTDFLADARPGGRGKGPVHSYGRIDVERFAVRQHGGQDIWASAQRADEHNTEDDTDMRVTLLEPIEPGHEVDIELAWTTKLPSIIERSGFAGSFHMVAQWFPKIARLEKDGDFAHFAFDRLSEFYADFGTYDVTISVPAGFVVGATGKQVSDESREGRRVVRHVQSDVHDFAFAAYDGFEELRRTVGGVDVRILFPKGHDGVAEEQLDVAAFGLRHFGSRYGGYPYPTLTIVHPPPGAGEAGGMEYPTLITTGGAWWRRGNLGEARALTLHELAHQYFYGLVATNERAWPFLDEGLATWAGVDALDTGWGNNGALALPSGGLRASTVLRYSGLPGGHDETIAKPAPDFASGYSYGRLVYARTALILETLDRAYHGAIRKGIGTYARRYRFAHPEPEQLFDVVREAAGPDAAEALRVCLYERGWIDAAIEDLFCADGTCSLIVTRRGNVAIPFDIAWLNADGTRTITRWNGKAERTTLTHDSPSPVIGAILDPDHRVLLDEDFANNAIGRGSRPSAWRTRGVAGFAASVALSAVSP